LFSFLRSQPKHCFLSCAVNRNIVFFPAQSTETMFSFMRSQPKHCFLSCAVNRNIVFFPAQTTETSFPEQTKSGGDVVAEDLADDTHDEEDPDVIQLLLEAEREALVEQVRPTQRVVL